MKNFIKSLIPSSFIELLIPYYHFVLSLGAAVITRFPARKLTVIEVGGTKGKSTVSEMIFAILTTAGHTPAMTGTIRFAIGNESKPNKMKMTMPGRGFIQFFLRKAIAQGATHAILEVTTEGAKHSRHRFLEPDIVIMTNVQKEHIESHGTFEKYVERKWELVHELEKSTKPDRALITNTDDEWNADFINAVVPTTTPYSVNELGNVTHTDASVSFTYKGTRFEIPLPGIFNAVNALGSIKVGEHLGIPLSTMERALRTMPQVLGRAESVSVGQPFLAIVDYAHTPDSLRALYEAFPNRRKICVLGNTGGGRDKWKRPEMAAIAEEFCDEVILTNEDPYDEDPYEIIADMVRGMKKPPHTIIDRKDAIHVALARARHGDAVLITGKGTDPYIMGANGMKQPWSDAQVVREELQKVFYK